jgi:hypothetical protein
VKGWRPTRPERKAYLTSLASGPLSRLSVKILPAHTLTSVTTSPSQRVCFSPVIRHSLICHSCACYTHTTCTCTCVCSGCARQRSTHTHSQRRMLHRMHTSTLYTSTLYTRRHGRTELCPQDSSSFPLSILLNSLRRLILDTAGNAERIRWAGGGRHDWS